MLRGDAEFLLQLAVLAVFLQQAVILLRHLLRVMDKLHPVVRQRYAPSAPVKHGNPQLLLQLADGIGQRRLGKIQRFRGLVVGSCL